MMKTTFLRSLLGTLAIAASLLAAPLRGATGDIYETNEGNLLRFRPAGGTPGIFTTGFTSPKGLVFDGNGHLYVADAGKNAVIQFTLDGLGTTYLANLKAPTGVALDQAGNLYVSESGGDILKFTPAPDKTKTTFAAATGASAGLVFDSSGNLFSSDFGGGKVYKFTPDGTKTTFASGLKFPAGLAFDSLGNLYVAESESGTILKFAPDGSKTNFATGIGRPFGVAVDSKDNVVVADNLNGATLRYTKDGVKSILFQSDFNTPQFLAIEPSQHTLLNISTRGFIPSSGEVLIAGFVIGGNGPVGTTILVRALGPSLAAFGVANPIPDPVLELRDASGTLLASNNDWKDTQENAISQTLLRPTDDHESAILITLHGGAFTAIVGSATGAAGTAVVEVYNLP